MAVPTRTRWQRRVNGRFRLHLASGAHIDFVGGVRLKLNAEDIAIDYDAYAGDSLVLAPAYYNVVAIEKIASQ